MGSRRPKLIAALKAAGLVAGLWAAIPALVAALMGAGWVYEHHGEAVHVASFAAVVIGFSAVAGGAFYCMFRRGGRDAG